MNKHIGLVKLWWKMKRRNWSLRFFNWLLRDKASGMEQIVQNAAHNRACALIMNWLDSKRIMHCRFCPNTEQLKRHHDYYLCEFHDRALLAKPSANGKTADPALAGTYPTKGGNEHE